jgi:hypothetical protein
MTDDAMEDLDRAQRDREAEQDELLERQEGTGYGEDEGERDEALAEEERGED